MAERGSARRSAKSGSSRARSTTRKAGEAKRAGTARAQARGGVEAKSVAELRDALRKNLIRPRDLVMLTRERIEEVLGDAVERGQLSTREAQRLGSNLLKRGRRETNDVLKDLEQLLGRGRDEIQGARSGVRRRAQTAATDARRQARDVRGRAARAAGVGSGFPIKGYDELNVGQITPRLADLTPAQLRKVRDYERRHANRKTVLRAIESKLR